MDVESRVQATLADVAESVFPNARKHFEAIRAKSWSQAPQISPE
jgi:hypothetical protein